MASTKIIPNIYTVREISYYHAATYYTHTRVMGLVVFIYVLFAFYFHFVNCGQIYHIYGVHLIICEFSKIMGFCQFVPSFRQQKSSQLSSQIFKSLTISTQQTADLLSSQPCRPLIFSTTRSPNVAVSVTIDV